MLLRKKPWKLEDGVNHLFSPPPYKTHISLSLQHRSINRFPFTHISNLTNCPHHIKGNMPEKHYYATGRGGSGNIKAAVEQPHPHMVKQGSQTPNLLQPVFSTGRGGAGNMFKNTDSKLSRKMQDVDPVDEDYISPVLSSDKNMSIGRGGFGNMISPKNSLNGELSRSKSHKDHHNHNHNHTAKKADSEKNEGGFFSKAKSLFKKK